MIESINWKHSLKIPLPMPNILNSSATRFVLLCDIQLLDRASPASGSQQDSHRSMMWGGLANHKPQTIHTTLRSFLLPISPTPCSRDSPLLAPLPFVLLASSAVWLQPRYIRQVLPPCLHRAHPAPVQSLRETLQEVIPAKQEQLKKLVC